MSLDFDELNIRFLPVRPGGIMAKKLGDDYKGGTAYYARVRTKSYDVSFKVLAIPYDALMCFTAVTALLCQIRESCGSLAMVREDEITYFELIAKGEVKSQI
ncbi:MAG: hypothetical protein LBI34_01730 [Puniceicoccales bacterium]|jgi:hypothetical protein|nr:hypothetical protein [Puniceicoccales bacterium]